MKGKIVYVSAIMPNMTHKSNGVSNSIYFALKTHYSLLRVNPTSGVYGNIASIYIGICAKICGLLKKGFVSNLCLVSWLRSKSIMSQLKGVEYDGIFVVDSVDAAFLKVDKPIFYRSDAIFHEYYDYYVQNVPEWMVAQGKSIEVRALHNSTLFFPTSDWVLDRIKYHGIKVNYNKICPVVSGANLTDQHIRYVSKNISTNKLKMIFVGYDVRRKGVDVAYQCMRCLNDKYHIDTNLIIIGGMPSPEIIQDSDVEYVGLVNKGIEKDLDIYCKLMSQSDIFIFPSKAEFSATVCCEAAAFGLPIFCYNTGGMSSYVNNGVNGYTLEMESSGEIFAEKIYNSLINGELNMMSVNARQLYLEKYNWTKWANVVSSKIESCI